MNTVLLGPPGAGKGTQAKRLEAALGLPHVASGDMFRDIRRESTLIARDIRRFMDRGEYVPDGLTIELVLKRLQQPDAREGFILDGFPRTRGQAEALDRALADEEKHLDRAVSLTAPSEVLLQRLAGRIICLQCHAIYNRDSKPPRHDMECDVCGHTLKRRSDESPEINEFRLHTFMEQTAPVVAYYRARNTLVEIEGARSMDEVAADIDQAVGLEGVR